MALTDRGWGRAKGPTAEAEHVRLADRLAAAVRCWEQNPTMNNYWRMLEACTQYEGTLR